MADSTIIILKNSLVSGATPGESDIEIGEVALSLAKGEESLWVKNSDGTVVNMRSPRPDLLWGSIFIKYEEKSVFLEDLDNDLIESTSIVFISDSAEIWVDGVYYSASSEDAGTLEDYLTKESAAETYATKEYVDNLALGGEVDLSDYAKKEDLLLSEDLVITGVTIGGLEAGETIEAGTSIESILKEMLTVELGVVTNSPAIKFSSSVSSSAVFEVGSTINPEFTTVFSDGYFSGVSGYDYTLSAGCEVSEVNYYKNNILLEGSSDTQCLSVGSTVYKVICDYTESANVPVSNLGNTLDDYSIGAGSLTSSLTYTAKYKYFIGYSDVSDPNTLSSSDIRSLSAYTGFLSTSGTTTTMGSDSIYSDGSNIVIACPNTYELSKVLGAMSLDILGSFSVITPGTVIVEIGDTECEYTAYILEVLGDGSDSVELNNIEFKLI